MLIKITNGSVSFGADTILDNIDIEIKDGEKIAIVGANGAGKSTLLRCIVGEIEMEEGTGEVPFTVARVGNPTIGYLKQISFVDESFTMLEEILTVFRPILDAEAKMQKLIKEIEVNSDEQKIKAYSALSDRFELLGGYTYQKEYSVMIKKFGFTEEDKSKTIKEFSGGERTKIAFIKLLLSRPDILLLDEPTNHLDISTVKWLENYIKTYKSAVVIVSHDRMFLEKTADKVYDIEYGETVCYKGNYSDFERQKRANYQKQLKDFEYQREEIKRLMRLVERFRYKATKAKMVQSKLKQIERMKIVDKPNRYDLKTFHADFQPAVETSKKVLTVKDLIIGYDAALAKINLEIFKGQTLGVIGGNGVGKSTFLKTLVGEINPLSGVLEFGFNVKIGYFNQQMAQYASHKTVFDDFYDEFPFMNETQVRNALGAFLFEKEEVFKNVDDLSGGEKVRLALCKMFKKQPNLLILDEPTNHMDMIGKETLENMLCEYDGTVVVVSHDRYFVDKVADNLLVFENSNAKFYSCTYSQYELSANQQKDDEAFNLNIANPSKKSSGAKRDFSTPLRDRAKKERRLKKLEELMKINESRLMIINEQLQNSEIYSNYVAVLGIQEEIAALQAEQESYSEEWLTLSEELENLH